MTILGAIVEYFEADPLRILYIVGGAGGLTFWLDRWRNRHRIRVRMLETGLKAGSSSASEISFEAENRGQARVSLEREIVLVGWGWTNSRNRLLLCGKRYRLQFFIHGEQDRSLDPHTPKKLTARSAGLLPPGLLIFHRFVFRASRGRSFVHRQTNPFHGLSGPVAYYFWLVWFRLTGKFRHKPQGDSSNYDQWKRDKEVR